jgi:cellobiose phosphorylase
MYRAAIESILGFKLEGDKLSFNPKVPKLWKEFSMDYRYHQTDYHIQVEMQTTVLQSRTELDGVPVEGGQVTLVNDRQPHTIKIVIESL